MQTCVYCTCTSQTSAYWFFHLMNHNTTENMNYTKYVIPYLLITLFLIGRAAILHS